MNFVMNVEMQQYKIYEQWANKTRHWGIISTKKPFNEFWRDHKRTLENMGMKLIAMIPMHTNK